MATVAMSEPVVQLSPDALRLDVFIPAAGVDSLIDLVARVRDRAADLAVRIPQSDAVLGMDLSLCPCDSWHTICVGEPPTPPIDGTVELALPIPVLSARHRLTGRRQAVWPGMTLARLHPAVPGRPGRDLLGRSIPVRAPREAALPQGENTAVSADCLLLQAGCSGEVVLRSLLIVVLPMQVHQGDVRADQGTLSSGSSLFITGSVHDQARVEADGEIYVQGDVCGGHLWSISSSVVVMGEIGGAPHGQAVVRASQDIICGPCTHARLTSGGDIRLRAPARRSELRASGGMYLPDSLSASLDDVRVHVDGGLFPPRNTLDRPMRLPPSRQHVRVATRLHALVAVQGAPPLQYRGCNLLNLSVGGARCELLVRDLHLQPGTVVQLRIMLSDSQDYVLLLARVARLISHGVVGLSFLQMTLRDRDRLTTFCLQLLLQRGHNQVALPQPVRHSVSAAS